MRSFQLVALTPPGLGDSAIAIAASRAGALGVLNLEFVADAAQAREAIAHLARFARGEVGIRLDSVDSKWVSAVLADFPSAVQTVILGAADPNAVPGQIAAVRALGRGVWLEVTTIEQARRGVEWEVDALVAKGHEAGGWVGEETTFILLQRLLAEIPLPVFARGGIGLHTAAACAAAGAAGVVLDSQLTLTRESALPEPVRAVIAGMDGSETLCLGAELGRSFRVYARPRFRLAEELAHRARSLAGTAEEREIGAEWRDAVHARTGWGEAGERLWPLGQDAALAAPLAERYHTVGGILTAMREAVDEHLEAARELRLLGEGSPLATSHGTRYPIVQGPMTRVSDVAPFALSVAEGGALPFLALALMRALEVESLLAETKQLLGERPWGVGILGFVPLDLRQEQLDVIRRYRPPFALIAGGRPDQARALEREGIPTYLHVPSPGLLTLFLQDGARRFVFEGRECGGHVGPRSSFVLWNSMVDVLLEQLPTAGAEECHVLFAGGVHDALSSAMVAALAAPLAGRGVRVGVLVGTAYLFTEEAVAAGAILPGFQQNALDCAQTVLLESGPGHAVRCVANAFTGEFERIKQQLQGEGSSAEEIRHALENLNVGRLRVASKGIERNPRHGQEPDAPKLVAVDPERQQREGMYMIGQVAALRGAIGTIAALHRDVSVEGTRRLEPAIIVGSTAEKVARPSRIAIVGISCILPKAPDVAAYWDNILQKVYAVGEIPKERWDWELYFDPDRTAPDKIYSKWGGFIDDVAFDPVEFGMPPNSLSSIDPMQLLALKAARQALEDAGYGRRPFDRSRTSVILGASGGTGELGALYSLRAGLPQLLGEGARELIERSGDRLPVWTEDSFAGLLLNVAAGRIANRLDLGGTNCIVDAACASSLAALYLAVRELESGDADLAITGGIDTTQSPFSYVAFSKTHALSPGGEPRTFDASADGIAISEGVVMLVLKRLADAERDGDRIYAVIQGVAGSSDGRAKGLTAPRPEGQVRALERAYAKAGISPTTVALFEAHGTGTAVGDQAEALSLSTFLEHAGAVAGRHAVGSVKSMIGHTKAVAGVAGLAKVALALHHRVLPPTLGVTTPNPKARFREGPLYVNSEARPWIHPPDATHSRRAGVSAFGFGGTNFHAVVEEYAGDFLPRRRLAERWPTELFCWAGPSQRELAAELTTLERALEEGARPTLAELAAALAEGYEARRSPECVGLAIVAASLEELRGKLSAARTALQGAHPLDGARGGIYLAGTQLAREGSLAFLFPGQGSQHPGMLADLAIHFDEVREAFERADGVLREHYPVALSDLIFPSPSFTPEEERRQRETLTRTEVAQPALGAASVGVQRLLASLGVEPAMVAGHSYGEYVALYAAGTIDEATLFSLSEARGRAIAEVSSEDLGTMAAVSAGPETVAAAMEEIPDVWIANLNAPAQTVISGARTGIDRAVERLWSAGVQARGLEVACAFHSPLVAAARKRLAERLVKTCFASPRLPVFSNTTGDVYPQEPTEIAALLAEHLVQPVRFAEQIEAMYRAGARLFVEVGPRGVLTGLTRQILGERSHLAVAVDQAGRSGLTQLQHMLGQLVAHGAPVRPTRLFDRRALRRLSLERLVEETRERTHSPTTWLINGGQARPASRPTPPPARPLVLPFTTEIGPANSGAALPVLSPALPPATHGRAEAHDSPSDAAEIMLQHQRLMNRFLETQRTVMTAFFAGTLAADRPGPMPDGGVTSSGRLSAAVADAGTAVADSGNGESAVSSLPDAPQPEEVLTSVLRIVSERTGYPPDMLGLELDLEADLGIDSIKRVEIIGELQRRYLPAGASLNSGAADEVTALRTLRALLAWLERIRGVVSTPEGGTASAAEQPSFETTSVEDAEPPRMTIAPVAAPPTTSHFSPPAGVVLVAGGGEIARLVADQLRSAGAEVARVYPAKTMRLLAAGEYEGDLATGARVEALLAEVRRQQGPLGGIVHLLALEELAAPPVDLAVWRERTALEVKSLFHLLRHAGADLRRPENIGAFALAAAVMGGAWGHGPQGGTEFFAAHGGLAGVLKTAAHEWPAVCCRAVDLDGADPTPTLAERLVAELATRTGPAQIGYRQGRRIQLAPRPAPLEPAPHAIPILESGSVVLVTGGARGITAEIALRLAEKCRPTLILVGRSLLPVADEPAEIARLVTPPEIRGALIERMRNQGEEVIPSKVGKMCDRLLREREIRTNLERLRRAGAQVIYQAMDVCDEAAMASLIQRIYRDYGRLDGVIHGAGVIEDRRIESKSADSFDRVFDTKADSAFVLSRLLRPEGLRFLALFSSVAATYGNTGQADYAAANEVLNTLALQLDARWPGRVVALGWGPWGGVGMVSRELERNFRERGIPLIGVPAGCDAFERELGLGPKGTPVVLLAGGAWHPPTGPDPDVRAPGMIALLSEVPAWAGGAGTGAPIPVETEA